MQGSGFEDVSLQAGFHVGIYKAWGLRSRSWSARTTLCKSFFKHIWDLTYITVPERGKFLKGPES